MLNASFYIFLSFEIGQSLEHIDQDYKRLIADESCVDHRMNTTLVMMRPFISMVHILMGKATEFESNALQNRLNWADAHKITVALLFGHYKQAVQLGQAFFQGYPMEQFDLASIYLFVGIANVALFKQTGRRKFGMCAVARKLLKKIDRICTTAKDYCLGKVTLLQAEISSTLSRNHERTVRKYLVAIALADSSKNPFEGAMAHERYGRYLGEHGDLKASVSHLRIACSLYQEWNAYRKVDLLQGELNSMVP